VSPRLPRGGQIEPAELPEGEALTVFRIVRTDNRGADEFVESFMSRAALDLPPRKGTPEDTHPLIRKGISVYDTRDAAEATARRFPAIGRFVAELRLTRDMGVRILRWGPRGHLTVWCDPFKLRDAVVDTIPVGERERGGADDAARDPR
jgi:hypothetical protein